MGLADLNWRLCSATWTWPFLRLREDSSSWKRSTGGTASILPCLHGPSPRAGAAANVGLSAQTWLTTQRRTPQVRGWGRVCVGHTISGTTILGAVTSTVYVTFWLPQGWNEGHAQSKLAALLVLEPSGDRLSEGVGWPC